MVEVYLQKRIAFSFVKYQKKMAMYSIPFGMLKAGYSMEKQILFDVEWLETQRNTYICEQGFLPFPSANLQSRFSKQQFIRFKNTW